MAKAIAGTHETGADAEAVPSDQSMADPVPRAPITELTAQSDNCETSFLTDTACNDSGGLFNLFPSLLSHVSAAFMAQVPLGVLVKDSIEYPDSFLGSEAVDTITFIIQISDRNLALLLGRALESQNFIYNVTYSTRLRDSHSEIYKIDPIALAAVADPMEKQIEDVALRRTVGSPEMEDGHHELVGRPSLPCGVFTLLTDCYSPTCTHDSVCYSVSCPRRLEQLARKSMKQKVQLWSGPNQSATDSLRQDSEKPQNDDWWSNTVPIEIVNSVSKEEEKRQNAIYDMIKTERNYVDELKMIQSLYALPLQSSDIIEHSRLPHFIEKVFFNVGDILTVNTKLLQMLLQRQRESHIVEQIGDIFVDIADDFRVYIEYCGNREYSRNEIAYEKAHNSRFKEFLSRCIVRTDSKADSKQELDGYLHKPITRMASYQLLLKAILSKTPEDHLDRRLINEALESITSVLGKMNEASGATINKIKLNQLNQLIFTDGYDLKLSVPERRHHYEGKLTLKRLSGGDVSVTMFLFDHLLLMARERADTRSESDSRMKSFKYQIYRAPMPLELVVLENEPIYSNLVRSSKEGSQSKGPPDRATVFKTAARMSTVTGGPPVENKTCFTLCFLSRHGSSAASSPAQPLNPSSGGTPTSSSPAGSLAPATGATAYSTGSIQVFSFVTETEVARTIWRDNIQKLKSQRLSRSSAISELNLILDSREALPELTGRIKCSAVVNGRLLVGTDCGLYISPSVSGNGRGEDTLGGYRPGNMRSPRFTKVVGITSAIQLDVLRDYDFVVILSDRTLVTVPLDSLDGGDVTDLGPTRKIRKVAEGVNFFKTGVCGDKTLVCAISISLSSTIKVFEPGATMSGKKRVGLGMLFRSLQESLRLYKEFYIPSVACSIHFLKTKLCVGCMRGFEVIDLETLDTQGLLDPADPNLDLALNRDDLKPLAIFRVEESYLLCYNEFAFYVNKLGQRVLPDFMIVWAGLPNSFACIPPFIFAFDSHFVEVRDVHSGELIQSFPGQGSRLLHCDTDVLFCVRDRDVNDSQTMFVLKHAGPGTSMNRT
ncbi:CNH domain-containing protein [Zopfochytrium polystomum]|nr:CNH domain-containing protein [Zopfochytrium polystomum]